MKRKLHQLKKGTTNVTKFVDLDTVKGCREFLNDVIYDGKPVTHFWNEKGERFAIADLDDENVISVAAQFYHDFFGSRPSEK